MLHSHISSKINAADPVKEK